EQSYTAVLGSSLQNLVRYFVCHQLTAGENISLGDGQHCQERPRWFWNAKKVWLHFPEGLKLSFSTLRMTDQIVVMEEGRIVGQGSQAELLALGGSYAHLFSLQAAEYP
ncbi:MAG: hypothetical protein Q6K35_09240, partial [Thermostichus sp. DG02_4_bins_136]